MNEEIEIMYLYKEERRIGYTCVVLDVISTLSLNSADEGRKKNRIEFKDHMVKDNIRIIRDVS